MMTDDGGRKRFILLLAGFILVVGLVFGAYQLFKYKFKADEITGVPTAPTGVTAVDNSDKTAINLNWQDVDGSTATEYKIERSASIWDDFTAIATQASSIKTYTDSNIVSGQRYYYKIIGHNSNGYSVNSKVATPTRVEYKDYLAGIGEMETSFTTSQQRYTSPGAAVNEVVDSEQNNSVASGVNAVTQYGLTAGDDYYYRIEKGTGIAGTNQQCFAIKQNSKSGNIITLRFYFGNGVQIKAGEFENGDTARFVIDKLSYMDANADSLPAGSGRTFTLGANASGLEPGNPPIPVNYTIPGTPSINDLDPSKRPNNINIEFPVGIPGRPTAAANAYSFDLVVNVSGADKLGSATPGICMDGAHFYVKKAAATDYTKVTVPANQDHVQNTFLSHSVSNTDDPYYIASNYSDSSMAYGADYLRLPAKYFNPNMRFEMYTARSLSDYRLGLNIDAPDAAMPSEDKLASLLHDHPDWFYTYDPTKLEPPSGDTRDFTDGVQDPTKAYFEQKLNPDGITSSPLNYVFDDYYQTEYLNNITDQSYITWWETNAAALAKKRGFDGVFLDVAAARSVVYAKKDLAYVCPPEYPEANVTMKVDGVDKSVPGCTVYNATTIQSRNLLKQVVPYIKSQNLSVTMNCGGCHLDTKTKPAVTDATDADIFYDPGYPANYTGEETEIINTPDNTPDSHFQEHAFLGIAPRAGLFNFNDYRQVEEWNKTITDMEKYAEINKNLPESQKKIYYVSSYAMNKTSPDPIISPAPDPPQVIKPADPINNIPTQAQLSASLDNYDTGWANQFIASYLLGSNKYTAFSIEYDDWSDGSGDRKEYPLPIAMMDKLGQAKDKRHVQFEGVSRDFDCSGSHWSRNCWKEAVNYRLFDNGLVIDNADTGEFPPEDTTMTTGYQSHTFVMPGNYVDEYGRKYPSGTTITLQKRTGRIFYKADKLDKPSISVTRAQTYSGSTSLSGTTDLFATSVTVNGQAANINTTNHTWTLPSLPLNIGANNISIINSGEGATSDPETVTVNRRKIGDANGDSIINKYDFSSLMLNWNRFEVANLADFNEDGSVGKVDFSMMMLNWGK